MAWTVAQNCSSIVTKRECTRHRQRTKQALGRIHIVSTLKRNALGKNHIAPTPQMNALCRNHIVSTPWRKSTVQKSHCVNTVEEKHWVEITLCQYRQRRSHWAEITLCQHHRRHSRRGTTKNVHCLCISLDCRRQDQCISSFIHIDHEVSRMHVKAIF